MADKTPQLDPQCKVEAVPNWRKGPRRRVPDKTEFAATHLNAAVARAAYGLAENILNDNQEV